MDIFFQTCSLIEPSLFASSFLLLNFNPQCDLECLYNELQANNQGYARTEAHTRETVIKLYTDAYEYSRFITLGLIMQLILL